MSLRVNPQRKKSRCSKRKKQKGHVVTTRTLRHGERKTNRQARLRGGALPNKAISSKREIASQKPLATTLVS